MLIAQISDLHVAPEDSYMRQFVDANELLRRAVEYLNTMTPRPDVVIATGDLTDHGTADEYVMLARDPGRARGAAVPHPRQPRRARRPALRDGHAALRHRAHVRLRRRGLPGPARRRSTRPRPGRHDGELDAAQLLRTRRHPRRAARPADVLLPAPPAVRDRHLVDGLHRAHRRPRARGDHPAPPAGAPRRRRARAPARSPPCGARRCSPPRRAPVTRRPSRSIPTARPGSPPSPRCSRCTSGPATRFVSHATVFDKEGPDLNIAELVSDWPSAKASILARGPMHKGSSVVG